MSFYDGLLNRVSTVWLAHLTNPDTTATSINTAVANAAISDAEAIFLKECGYTADSTDIYHMGQISRLTLGLLESYRDGEYKKVENVIKELRVQRKQHSVPLGVQAADDLDDPFGSELDDFIVDYNG